MINYILFTTLLAILLAVYYCYLVRNYYMDLSINQLRETKFRTLVFMAEYHTTAKSEDLEKAKLILKGVNSTIQHFEKVKFFPFRLVKVIVNIAIFSGQRLDKIEISKPDSDLELSRMFAKAIALSIKSVPFVRFRILVFLFKQILKFLTLLGLSKARAYRKRFDDFLFAEHNYFDDHCLV